jgi:hypothetical protein
MGAHTLTSFIIMIIMGAKLKERLKNNSEIIIGSANVGRVERPLHQVPPPASAISLNGDSTPASLTRLGRIQLCYHRRPGTEEGGTRLGLDSGAGAPARRLGPCAAAPHRTGSLTARQRLSRPSIMMMPLA